MKIYFLVAIAIAVAIPTFCQSASNSLVAEKQVIAVVLGKTIHSDKRGELSDLILRPLLDEFVHANNLNPTAAEIEIFEQRDKEMQKQRILNLEGEIGTLVEQLKSPSLSSKSERQNKDAALQELKKDLQGQRELYDDMNQDENNKVNADHSIAYMFIKQWKVNKALYDSYGGRVAFQQAGPEPLDAYLEFLKEQQKNGKFKIIDQNSEAEFWKEVTSSFSNQRFYSREEGKRMMSTPWWLVEKPPRR